MVNQTQKDKEVFLVIPIIIVFIVKNKNNKQNVKYNVNYPNIKRNEEYILYIPPVHYNDKTSNKYTKNGDTTHRYNQRRRFNVKGQSL